MSPNQGSFGDGHMNHNNDSTAPKFYTSSFSASYYSPMPPLSQSLAPRNSLWTPPSAYFGFSEEYNDIQANYSDSALFYPLRTPPSAYFGFSEEYNDIQANGSDSALFYPLPTTAAKTSRAVAGFENPSLLPENFSVPEKPVANNGVPAAMTSFCTYEAAARPSPNWNREALERLMMNDIHTLAPETVKLGCWTQCCIKDPFLSKRLRCEPQVSPVESGTSHKSPRVITHYATAPNGADKYVCSDCNGQYGRRQDCNRHIVSAHVKTKTYFCRQHGCSGSFCRADVLKRHLRKVHHIDSL